MLPDVPTQAPFLKLWQLFLKHCSHLGLITHYCRISSCRAPVVVGLQFARSVASAGTVIVCQ